MWWYFDLGTRIEEQAGMAGRMRVRVVVLLISALLLAQLSVGAVARPAAAGIDAPGGPVLIVTDPSNPFTRYYSEILSAEGLNYYSLADLGQVSAATLGAYDVVILGEMDLSEAQASMLSTWVTGGGNLIAMRPDRELAVLLGLTDAHATLSDARLKIDNSSGPGTGIVGQPIQYHGTADRYTLNGATALATLYADATTATANPAVTMRSVGSQGGQAAAFTYDLARSIVLTRQGNVAWAGQQRDGVDGYEASEMFMGAPSGAPDWNDLDQATIPIADEQQRLLANMVVQTNQDNEPLPRFWYYPRDLKAVVIMTGDDHANNGTAGRFDQYKALSPAGCNVANWECIRSSSYIYTDTPLSSSKATTYNNQGFEIGLHVSTGCAPWGSAAALDSMYSEQLNVWEAKYSALPSPSSSRTHCVEWDDWSTQPKTKLRYGMRLDTDYYYYPASWVNDRPGYFNGTAQIMRFADLDGSLIDVYQATTQMTDESGQAYPSTIDTLLDKAIGPEGYYAALTANMHTDVAESPASDAIIAAAQARDIPVVSGRQMLTWLDARNSSSFESINWNDNALTFTVTGGANGLRGMVPLNSATGILNGLTCGGNAVPYTVETIKGIQYAFFTATPCTYTATYGETTAPTVLSTTPASGANNVSTTGSITVEFSEAMDPASLNSSTIELRNASNALTSSTVAYNATTRSAVITPTAALTPATTHTATVKGLPNAGARDVAGNTLAADYTFAFTTVAVTTVTLDDLVVHGANATGGYDLFAADGGVFAFGDTMFHGSAGSLKLNQPVVGAARTPSGNGYWLVASDGGIFNYGDATFYGSTGAIKLASPIVAMAATASGEGYWLVASDGGVFAYGDATFYGSTGATELNSPIVAIAATASGEGYWLAASDGGIFAFGDARFYGSTGSLKLNKPVVGIAATASGEGYWLAASDGGIFNYGDAGFYGSTGAIKLNSPIVAMAG